MNNEQLIVNKLLISQAEELATEHDLFNDQYIVTGRRKLYELLSKIMELAEQFEASPDKEDLFFNLRYKLKEASIKVQENTSDVALLVKYVTRADRKTAHVYSRAIETAMACHYKAAEFPQAIIEAGGLEKLRLASVDDEKVTAQKQLEDERLELTRTYLQSRSYFPFAKFAAPNQFNDVHNENCEFEYVMCTVSNGQYNVVCKLPTEVEFENYALKKLSTYLCKDLDLARESIAKMRIKANEEREKLNQSSRAVEQIESVDETTAI